MNFEFTVFTVPGGYVLTSDHEEILAIGPTLTEAIENLKPSSKFEVDQIWVHREPGRYFRISSVDPLRGGEMGTDQFYNLHPDELPDCVAQGVIEGIFNLIEDGLGIKAISSRSGVEHHIIQGIVARHRTLTSEFKPDPYLGRIEQIKQTRDMFGVGLKEAKEFVDEL